MIIKKTLLVGVAIFLRISILFCSTEPKAALTHPQGQKDVLARMARVENGLLSPVLVKGDPGWNISERMKFYEVPGVSIAVIENFKIAWAKGYGVKDVLTGESVRENTMFQAASISKSFNATAIMKEVQEGKLSLDANVNDYLQSWKLPENEFTAKNKVTLANLLSHTGGITVSSFSGYPAAAAVPTVQQILRGESPANNPPVAVEMEPGKTFSYSGGGATIAQLVLIELEKKPYPQIMNEFILTPLQMTHSTFAQPLPEALKNQMAAGHSGGQPVDGKFFIYPELAAAGLWSTPTDLAKFAIEHQLSILGRSNKILAPEWEEKMITPYISDNYGMGFNIYGKKGTYFEHSGGNRGFASLLLAHKTKGYGMVVMINSDAFDLILEILRAIANEYEWEDYLPEPYTIVPVPAEKLQRYAGRYLLNDDNVISVNWENGHLRAERSGQEPTEIFPIAENEFISKQENMKLEFLKGAAAAHDTLKILLHGQEFSAPRIGKDKRVPFEYMLAGETDKALELYKAIREMDPQSPLIRYDRLAGQGESLWFQNQREKALLLFRMLTELYPDSEKAFLDLAEISLMAGNKGLAKESYEKLLKVNPQNVKALEKLRELKAEK